jgi:long-chain acyl-CoA synthetase
MTASLAAGAPSPASSQGAGRPAPGTLNQLFFECVAKYDKPDALQFKRGGRYQPISHRDLAVRVRRIAMGLLEQGMHPGDRVGILSENRPEWAIADYACLTAGLIDVPLYPSLPAPQLVPMLADSGATAVFVSTAEQAAKIAAIRDKLPAVRLVISFNEEAAPGVDLSLGEIEAWGAAADTAAAARVYRERALAVRPEDLATIIYTSGTTGEPKGVMLTHDNIHSNVMAARDALPAMGQDITLSFLPLSHIFGRMADHYLMFAAGASIAYAESFETLAANFREVRPTFVLGVPRVYEKVYAAAVDKAMHGGALTRRIFLWARAVGEQCVDERLAGRQPHGGLAVRYAAARALVFSRISSRLGGRIRYFVSGGAPLSREVHRFFHAAGLTILEGYGLTETSPVICVNTPARSRMGTVGPPLAGVEVRIASDGEILTRGPHVMRGYFNKPAETAEAIDAEGWFHTGDIGELHDGFLTITDRKKDLIVTAGGKNIAPAAIENRVRTNPFVSEVVMIGDRRKFPSLLVVPNFARLERWAASQSIKYAGREALIADPAVRAKMDQEVLAPLGDLAHFEQPKKIALLPQEFSIDRGELTPKMNVKRRVIDRLYKPVIDALYTDS